MRRHAVVVVAALPVLALALAGCGGSYTSSASGGAGGQSSTSASTGGGTTLALEADMTGAFEFDRTKLSAPAGKVTLEMTNPSAVPHDIAIKGNGVDVVGKIVKDGGTSTVTADLKPGTYTFLCTVDSHAANGMEGTLTVK